MQHTDKRSKKLALTLVVIATSCLFSLACTGGDAGPRQGTPEWFFAAAEDNFAIPDYQKTVDQLKDATKAEGEIGEKATLWRAVLTAGLARGYDDLTDAFVEGIEANEARVEEFQSPINEYRRRTRVNAIAFSESVGQIETIMGEQDSVPLVFPLPEGSGIPSPLLATIQDGNKIDAAQTLSMESQTLTRGIYSAISELVGGAEFSAISESAAAGNLQAPRDAMEFGIARILLDISVMFDREGINDPRVRKFVLDLAEKWAEPHLEAEEPDDRVEEFKFDVENEHRDIAGKRRMKKKDDA